MFCETVKDFVVRVGKVYEKAIESSEEVEVMVKKVCFLGIRAGAVRAEKSFYFFYCVCFLFSVLF